jgi:hypothetical protein
MVGFVDDCTQGVNDFSAHPQPSSADLIYKMQEDSQLWNDLLWTSGGALELPKCSFQMIETQWNGRGTPFLRGGKDAPTFRVRNGADNVMVRQTGNYESRKSLGVHLNPAGLMKTQMDTLLAKSNKFKECILANVLSRREAQMLYHGIYLPSVTYPMAMTHLTEAECHTIETGFLQALMPRMGYARTIATAIRRAPSSWGGAGLRPLFGEQSVATVQLALRSLRSQTNPGKALRINLSWAQAYCGLSTALWENPHTPCPHVPEPWIMGIRNVLAKIDGKIILEDKFIWPTQRENDWYIMDRVMALSCFTNADIEGINACRRYLQSVTAADVADEAGTHIKSDFITGTIVMQKVNINGEMFNQPRPDQGAWRSWRRFWKQTTDGNDYRLLVPLRSWIVPAIECRHKPTWVWDPTRFALYHKDSLGDYRQLQLNPRRYVVVPAVIEPATPSGYPVCAVDLGGQFVVRHTYQVAVDFQEGVDSWANYILTMDAWERELLSLVTLSLPPHAAMNQINDGLVFIASDGSVLNRTSASFGVTIYNATTQTNILQAKGPAPGSRPSSFRAEAYGALAALRAVWRLSQYTTILPSSTICHWIDNSALVRRLQRELKRAYQDPHATLQPDWDVIQCIVSTVRSLGTASSYSVKWIKSHQDEHQPIRELSFAARLNCEADKLAGEFQSAFYRHRPSVPMIAGTSAQLFIGGETVNGNYKQAIRNALSLPPYYAYLEQRFGWTPADRQAVDWESFRRVIRSFRTYQATVVKHIHGIAPTGKYANRYDKHQPASCPACQHESECNNHLLSCLAPSRQQWRVKFKRRMYGMQQGKTQTDPLLWVILDEGIRRVQRGDLSPIDAGHYPTDYRPLIQHQNRIGWIQLFRGRWVLQWSILHEKWSLGQDPSTIYKNGNDWTCAVGRVFMTSWLELWNLRNAERHTRDETNRESNLRTIVRSQLTEIYSYRNRVRPVDRDLYQYETVEDHLNQGQSLEALQDWCSDTYPAVLASVSLAARLGVQNNAGIAGYMLRNGIT